MRDLLTTFVNALLSAQADAVCGAGYGERSGARSTPRNGYRHRDLDTRVGTLDVAAPNSARDLGAPTDSSSIASVPHAP